LVDQKGPRFLPPIGQIGIKGHFFRYHVEPTGKELVIEPVQVRATSLRFHGEQLQVSMVNEREGWWLEGEGGELKAPVGSFRLGMVNLSRKDAQGRLWTLLAFFLRTSGELGNPPIAEKFWRLHDGHRSLHFSLGTSLPSQRALKSFAEGGVAPVKADGQANGLIAFRQGHNDAVHDDISERLNALGDRNF